jgi:hypothetical protein
MDNGEELVEFVEDVTDLLPEDPDDWMMAIAAIAFVALMFVAIYYCSQHGK